MGSLTQAARAILTSRTTPPNPMEIAVERLGSAIRLGLVDTGTQLPPERELAALIGVSRATLREAIRLFSEQGALEAHRGRNGGTFVVSQPAIPGLGDVTRALSERGTDLEGVLDQRRAIECCVAELAAERARPEHLERMRQLLDAMEDAHESTPAYRRLDTELHLELGAAAASDRLLDLLAESHRELSDLMAIVPHSAEIRRHSSAQHQALVREISRGRPDAARKVMSEHLAATESFLRGLLADVRSDTDAGDPAPPAATVV